MDRAEDGSAMGLLNALAAEAKKRKGSIVDVIMFFIILLAQ
jgi:hypothetical protein